MDTEHCLLIVGWEEGRLSAYAYVAGERLDQIVVLPNDLGGTPGIISL